jgi:hypothetical protein
MLSRRAEFQSRDQNSINNRQESRVDFGPDIAYGGARGHGTTLAAGWGELSMGWNCPLVRRVAPRTLGAERMQLALRKERG